MRRDIAREDGTWVFERMRVERNMQANTPITRENMGAQE